MIDVIIPAAKSGQRMKKIGPKPIIKISRYQTIIQRQISILKKYFSKINLYIVVGPDKDKIKQHVLKFHKKSTFIENSDYNTLNVNHSIKMGLQYSKSNNIMILYGDLVFDRKIFDKTDFTKSTVFIEKYKNFHNKDVGCVINNGKLESMMWNIPEKWCQIIYFTKKETEILRNLNINSRSFGYEIVNQIINSGGLFNAQKITGQIIDIDTTRDIKKIKNII